MGVEMSTPTIPEPTESANDRDYQDYLTSHSNGAAGFLMLIAGLEGIYEAIDEEEEEEEDSHG